MSERLINSAWRFVLISVIFVLAASAMFQLYQGMLDLVVGHWNLVLPPIFAGMVMSIAVYWLARNREELVDSETLASLRATSAWGSQQAARETESRPVQKQLEPFMVPASFRWPRAGQAAGSGSAVAPGPNRLAA